jgi:hypothetical protein
LERLGALVNTRLTSPIAESDVTNLVTDLALKAPLASPALTGTPSGPTAAQDTDTTQLATTAYVQGQAAVATPLADGVAAIGISRRYARQDHVHPAGAGGGPTITTLGSDATAVVGTAYADAASGLNITVTASTPLHFAFRIKWVANATTTGASFSINGPTLGLLSYSYLFNATATAISGPTNSTVYNDTLATAGAASDATNNFAYLEGTILPSASGTLALRARAEVASPGSVTVKAGSSVMYW